MCIDVKYFYLNILMRHSECMHILITLVTPEFISNYTPQEMLHNGYLYMDIHKVVCELL